MGEEDSTIDVAQEVIKALTSEELMELKVEYDGETEISVDDGQQQRLTIKVPPRPPRVKPDLSQSTSWHTLSSPFKNPLPLQRSVFNSELSIIRQAPPLEYSQSKIFLMVSFDVGSPFYSSFSNTVQCMRCKV